MSGTEARWIGDYFIDGELGRGAMGVVYRVRHRAGHGPYALKLLRSETLEDSRALKRFAAEVGSQQALGAYPGIVGVVDSGFAARGPYYVMPLVEGTNLRELLRDQKSPLPEERALEYVGAVTRALAYAHDRGFVHRDVKPENVMVTPEGEVFLTDFGIVRVLGGLNQLTRTGELLGTPMFMAPEQVGLDHGKPGPPTDVYAIGVILYQIICKRSPYEALTSVALMSAILQGDPYPSPASLRPGLSKAWVRVLDRCLARDPQSRYPSGGALWGELEVALAGPVTTRARTWRLALVAGALIALAGLVFALLQLQRRGAQPSPVASASPSPSLAASPSPSLAEMRPSATPTPTPTPSPSLSPAQSFAANLHAIWVSGDEAAYDTFAAGVGGLQGERLAAYRRYEELVKVRRAWRERLETTHPSRRQSLRQVFADEAQAQSDPELKLLARGFEALVAVGYDDGIHVNAPFVFFRTGELPALPELMPYVALVRPPADALARWPASRQPSQRARVAAWVGDVETCRESLAELTPPERAATGWSLFAFVDPAELDLPDLTGFLPKTRSDEFFWLQATGERRLAEGDPLSAALHFMHGSGYSEALWSGLARFGLLRCYAALGRLDLLAAAWAPSVKDLRAGVPVLCEISGLAVLIAESCGGPGASQAEARLLQGIKSTYGRSAEVFAGQSPWTNRVRPQRGTQVPMTRLERQGGSLSERFALAEAGADGAVGLGLARILRLARSAPSGGVDLARDLQARLDRYTSSAPSWPLRDAARAQLDLLTCDVGPPPASLVAESTSDELAAELVWQHRLARYQRAWFAAAERRLLAAKPLPRDAAGETLGRQLAQLRADAQGTGRDFPESSSFRLFRARLLIEAARLAWLYEAEPASAKDLGRRVEAALGPLLEAELAGKLGGARLDPEALLDELGQVRARPELGQAWSLRALAGGPQAEVFHRARRALEFDAPIVALGQARGLEELLAEGRELPQDPPRIAGQSLGVYSLRAARACAPSYFSRAWSALWEACERQPDLLPWAVEVLRARRKEIPEGSPLRRSLDALSWIETPRDDIDSCSDALHALRAEPRGPRRALAELCALVRLRPRNSLVDFLASEVAFEVQAADPTSVSPHLLLQANGILYTDTAAVDRALGTGLVYDPASCDRFLPDLATKVAGLQRANSWGDPKWAQVPRLKAALELRQFVRERQGKAGLGSSGTWAPDPRGLAASPEPWQSSGRWTKSLGALALEARGHAELGRRGPALQAALRHFFLTRPRSLSGVEAPAPLRILPRAATPAERAGSALVRDAPAWRLAARLVDASESWRLLGDLGALAESEAFTPFPAAFGRTRGSNLTQLRPRFGAQPGPEFVRWAALGDPSAPLMSEAFVELLGVPGLEPGELARDLSWVAERRARPEARAALRGLALWAAARGDPARSEGGKERLAALADRYDPALVSGAGPRAILLLSWPKLLAGLIKERATPSADAEAARALGALQEAPAWLESEPLLPRLLKRNPKLRAALLAKRGERDE